MIIISDGIWFFLILIPSFLMGLLILFSAYNNGSNGFYATPLYVRFIASLPFLIGSIYFYNTNDITIVLVGYILLFVYKKINFYP